MTDKQFVKFCDERARVLVAVNNASYCVNVLARDEKKRYAWLEFVGLIETAHLIWYYEYTNNISN